MTESSDRKRVLIVGAGFAGLHCAQQLASMDELEITLLDRNNYQQFQPLLYQVATGALTPDNAAFNLRDVFRSHRNVMVRMGTVVSVDLNTKTAVTKEGDTYTGDYIVLAAGAQANFFGIPGADTLTFPMYSLQDAERLRSRLIELLEAAARTRGHTDSQLKFVVVGGGATGVETAGAIADILQRATTHLYPDLDMTNASVTIVDRGQHLLAPFTGESQDYASKILQDRGVVLQMESSVSKITESGVVLSDGTMLRASLVIWAGGLMAADLSARTGLSLGQGHRIDVQPDLTVAGHPNVYALGDFANVQGDTGTPLPQLASVAQQAGVHCAKNIAADLSGNLRSAFAYQDKGIMAMIGRNAAVAEVGAKHHALTGAIAFAAWLGVHALLLTTARAKLGAFFEWAWDYFGGVRMDAILDRPSWSWAADKSDRT